MEKLRKRANRRSQERRIKKKLVSKKYYGRRRGEWTTKRLGICSETRKCFSHKFVNNRRKYDGDTVAEKRVSFSEQEWDQELV